MKKRINKNIMKNVKIFGINYQLDVTYKYIKVPKLNVEEQLIKIVLPKNRKRNNIKTFNKQNV